MKNLSLVLIALLAITSCNQNELVNGNEKDLENKVELQAGISQEQRGPDMKSIEIFVHRNNEFTLSDINAYYKENLSIQGGAMIQNDVHNFIFQVMVEVYGLAESGDIELINYYVEEMSQVDFLHISSIGPFKQCLKVLIPVRGENEIVQIASARNAKSMSYVNENFSRKEFREEYEQANRQLISMM